jgi:hypothetical protein
VVAVDELISDAVVVDARTGLADDELDVVKF